MFKNFKKNDKYFTIALYAFVVVALLIALIFAFINLGEINAAIKGFFGAIAAFIYGFVIAYICHPLYEKLYKYAFKFVENGKPRPKLRKILSLILTYVIFFSIITILLFAIMPSIIESIYGLVSNINAENITNWFNSIIDWLSGYFPNLDANGALEFINSLIFDENGALNSDISTFIGQATNFSLNFLLNFAKALIDQVFAIIVGIILSVYFLIHAENIGARLKKGICAMCKKETYEKVMEFAQYTDKTFGRYLIGTICDSMIVGLVVGILLAIFDITNYAVLIGVICGCTNVIPFFGPFIGAIPSTLIILISSGPLDQAFWKAIAFVVLIVIVQQLDGNIFAPHIIGASIGLTPIGVIAAVTICSHLFGFLGMLIGVPLCAVLTYFFTNMLNKKLKKKNLPSDTTLYTNHDIFNNEEFIKASFDVEAQSRIEMKEAVEKAKEGLELHQIGLHEAQERIINEKEQVAINPDEASADEAADKVTVSVGEGNDDSADETNKK